MVNVVSEWGYRVIDANGKKHFITRAQAQESGISEREAFFSTQSSKTLFDFGDAFLRPVGMRFEVVPQRNPLSLGPGDALPIQIFFDGFPLPNGEIPRGRNAAPLKTDANGMASIPIQAGGWQKVLAIHDVPAPERPDIDYYRFFTFLVFESK